MLNHMFLSVMKPALPSSEAYIERRDWIANLSTGNFQWLNHGVSYCSWQTRQAAEKGVGTLWTMDSVVVAKDC